MKYDLQGKVLPNSRRWALENNEWVEANVSVWKSFVPDENWSNVHVCLSPHACQERYAKSILAL